MPYTLNNQQHLIAGYTCTPLVKFPIADLKPGEKVRGTTIAEFGSGNRVLDMIVYRKGGQEFLLTANNSRGVMKIPTNTFATATPITTPVETETGGVPFEKVTSMTGIEQLDKLDDNNSIVIARTTAGGINLQTRSSSVMNVRMLCAAAVTSSLVIAAACGRSGGLRFRIPPSGSRAPRTAEPRTSRSPGCRARRSARFDAQSSTADQWSGILRVSVDDAAPGMLGTYSVADESAAIHAVVPLDPGRQYQVRFDPARLPAGGANVPALVATVGQPALHTTPSTVVARVYPTSDVVPENLLRMYIEFSGPMGRPSGIQHMKLLDDSGKEIAGAFLPLDYEFWSPDHTRFTAFFDPGRVKDGHSAEPADGATARLGALGHARHQPRVARSAWTAAEGRVQAHRCASARPQTSRSTRPRGAFSRRAAGRRDGARRQLSQRRSTTAC